MGDISAHDGTPHTEADLDSFLTTPEAAAHWRCSTKTVLRRTRDGLRFAKVGGRSFRFRRRWLDEFAERQVAK